MHSIFRAFMFLGLIAVAAPSYAQISISINIGPPRPHYEVRGHAPDPNSIWIAGYYVFNSSRRDYDWVPGRWEARPSPYHYWVAPRYVRKGDKYLFYEGKWKERKQPKFKQGERPDGGQSKGPGNSQGQGKGKGKGKGHK